MKDCESAEKEGDISGLSPSQKYLRLVMALGHAWISSKKDKLLVICNFLFAFHTKIFIIHINFAILSAFFALYLSNVP